MARKTISQDQLDGFEIDESDQLFWRGKAVVLERRLTLKGWELVIAGRGCSRSCQAMRLSVRSMMAMP